MHCLASLGPGEVFIGIAFLVLFKLYNKLVVELAILSLLNLVFSPLLLHPFPQLFVIVPGLGKLSPPLRTGVVSLPRLPQWFLNQLF